MEEWVATVEPSEWRLITRERRRFYRAPINLHTRCLTERGEEFEAQTVDAAAGGLGLASEVQCRIGEEVVAYVEELGRISGRVARRIEGGFALSSRMTPAKRDKIADQLIWLINRDRLNLRDDRPQRVKSTAKNVRVMFDDVVVQCEPVDISILGVSLKTSGPRPNIGGEVMVGKNKGRCARYMDGGFAVEFHGRPKAN